MARAKQGGKAKPRKVAASHDMVEELVHQFSDPFAFYRELIQNSIDAGSTRIEVTLRYQPPANADSPGMMTARIDDWGEGMTRQTIENYLLTKFRSSKEGDLTKIGKFGIGFLSIFSPKPDLVVLETGRDGEHWRLLFHPDRSYELLANDTPVDGTRIALHKTMTPAEYLEFRSKSADAVQRWCRHSEADVAFSAGGEDGGEPPAAEPVRRPLVVDAPFQVVHEEEGTTVVAGPARAAPPECGFYNKGLTLLESNEVLVPGVTFKIVSRYLEHTLTRDNVKRDEHFERAMKRVHELVLGPMTDRLGDELRALAERPEPGPDYLVLLKFAVGRKLAPARIWLPRAPDGAVDLRTVKKAKALLVGLPGCSVAAALARAGNVVVRRTDRTVVELAVTATAMSSERADMCFSLAEPDGAGREAAAEQALCAALMPLLADAGARCDRVVVAAIHGRAHDHLAILVDELGRPQRADQALRSPFRRFGPDVLCLNRAHADVAAAVAVAARRPHVAAALIARRIAAGHGVLDDAADRRLTNAGLEK